MPLEASKANPSEAVRCTVEVEFHFSLGHQKVTLESFLALRVWLVGLESCWGFPVSDAC